MYGRINRITDEELASKIAESHSASELMRKVGYPSYSGDSIKALRKRAAKIGLELPNGNSNRAEINHLSAKERMVPAEEALILNPKCHISTVRRKYLDRHAMICSECSLGTEWNGRGITHQLDHIDGNRMNNLESNLRWLCPNCHSQTDTFGSKNSLMVRTNSRVTSLSLTR